MSTCNPSPSQVFQSNLKLAYETLDPAGRGSPANMHNLKALGLCILAGALGGFAQQLDNLTDMVEASVSASQPGETDQVVVAPIKVELLVSEIAFTALGKLYHAGHGALKSDGTGWKDNSLLDTYRIPIAIDVSALKQPEAFVASVRQLSASLYAESERYFSDVHRQLGRAEGIAAATKVQREQPVREAASDADETDPAADEKISLDD